MPTRSEGFDDLVALLAEIWTATGAQQFAEIARHRLAGLRLSIPTRPPQLTPEQVHEAAPYQPRKAAARLGIHPSTAYRALRRGGMIR